MICVPYIINDNYKVARLSGTQDARPCHIIEKAPGSNEVKLFAFERKQTAFDPNMGYGRQGVNDFIFEIKEDECTVKIDSSKHSADIVIALSMHHVSYEPQKKGEQRPRMKCLAKDFGPTANGLCVRKSAVFFDFRAINNKDNDILTINICLKELDQNLFYDFSANIAPHNNIYDIVIDFGSEASQIWINRRCNDPTHVGNMMSLFRSIKNRSKYKTTNDKDVYQHDPSTDALYRSLFFVKNEIAGSEIEASDMTFINLEDDLKKLLEKNVALPNMKLMDHSNVPLPEFIVNSEPLNIYQRVNEIRAIIIKFFFKTALSHIDRISNQPVACKITFLVPNTYTQATLSDVHTQLIKDLQQLRKEQSFEKICGDIEVSTFSESDASFFGWYSAGDFNKADDDKRILIVDIGKGTTDFSVLRISSSNGQVNIERLARSGFVGAGNVLTFALLASVIYQIAIKLGTSSIADIYGAIRKMAYHTDRAKKNFLYRELERLKCAQHISGRKTLAQFINSFNFATLANIGSLNIERLTEILQEANNQECFQQDDNPVVCGYAKQITNMLIEELRYVYDEGIHIDKLLLSGRGAMSQPLVNAIRDSFAKIDPKIEITRLSPNETKAGCLKGPLNHSLHLDHQNMSIVGWPQQKRNIAMRHDTANDQQVPQEETNGPATATTTKKQQSMLKRIKHKLLKFAENIELQGADDETTQKQLINECNQTVTPKEHTAKLQKVQGTETNLTADTNLFIIGNRRCTADLGAAGASLGIKQMYFDGHDFLLRDTQNCIRFIPDPNDNDEGFLTETFFPMTEPDSQHIPDLPRLNYVLKTLLKTAPAKAASPITSTTTGKVSTANTSTPTGATTTILTANTSIDDEEDFAADED